jgi:nucleotide-binding universal stress UspA family protein
MPGVVVGIDGSQHSIFALEWALKQAALQHSRVTVLTVNSVPASGWTGVPVTLPQDSADLEKARHAAEEMTLKVLSQLGEAQPASVTIRAVSGFPATELIEASRDADLLVVGSRGAGGFAKLIMGSVSSQVVNHSSCPVVVVRGDR